MKKWALFLFLLLFLTITTCVTQAPFASADAPPPEAAPVELPLLVNLDNPLPDGYKPEQLVDLYEHKRSFKLRDSGIYMEAHVFKAMNAMFKAAKDDGVTGFIITSGYRTLKQQTRIYDSDTEGVAAKPGYSEHQTGLAFDVAASGIENFGQSRQYKWMKQHCWEYGFIIRYPKSKVDLTRIPFEPWHYRYVGVEHAMKIKDAGMCLEEYIAVGGNVDAAAPETVNPDAQAVAPDAPPQEPAPVPAA